MRWAFGTARATLSFKFPYLIYPPDDRGADSDQTKGKAGLCDLVDHLVLKLASFHQGVAHDSETQEIVHSVRDAGGGASMRFCRMTRSGSSFIS